MNPRSCPVCGHLLEAGNDPAATVRCTRCGTVDESNPGTDMGLLPPPPDPIPWPPRRPQTSVVHDPEGATLPHLPGYETLEFIGKGKHGTVVKARQTGLKRLVAIKLLDDLTGGPDEKLRFRLEAETLLRLDHENIVSILDVRESEGGLYLAMEYCSGGSLETRLNRGPLPQDEAVALLSKLARAVQAAHDKGIVHGELAAANVFWNEDQTPKLGGFGLARLMTGRESEAGADIEALGKLLRSCVGTLPPGLEAIASRCESSVLETRYRGAAALGEDLDRFQVGTVKPSERSAEMARLVEPMRRRWYAIPVLVAVFLFLAGSLAALLLESGRASLPVDRSAADLWVGADTGRFDQSGPIPVSTQRLLHRVPGVQDAELEACLVGLVNWRKPGGGRVPVLVLGSELKASGLGPLASLPTRTRTRLQAAGSVVVCPEDLPRLGLSDGIDEAALLGDEQVRVVGHAPYPASPLGPLVFCSPETARALLGVKPDSATYLLARCDDAGSAVRAANRLRASSVSAQDKESLSLSLRLSWLATATRARLWAGVAVSTLLATALVLGRLIPREAGETHGFAWTRAAAAVVVAALVADLLVRGVLAWGWPNEARLFPFLVFEGTIALCALAMALLAGVCVRPRRAAVPVPVRGRPATRAR